MTDVDYAKALRLIRKHMQPGDTVGKMFMRLASALETYDQQDLKEKIAIGLWHRFAPESHEEWSEETHASEYRDAADGVLFLARQADRSERDEFLKSHQVQVANLLAEIDRLRAQPQEVSVWRPIETAPKDGTLVDLLFRGNMRFTDCKWSGDAWWATEQYEPSVCVSHGISQPLYWMPLPSSPMTRPESK